MPEKLKGGAAKKVVTKLLDQGLLKDEAGRAALAGGRG